MKRIQLNESNPEPVLVVGSVAYDNIETPSARDNRILGGSASYAALAASYFAPTRLVGAVGHDFADADTETLRSHGIDLEGLRVDESGPTFTWTGKYHENFRSRETLSIELNVFEKFRPDLPEAFKSSPYVLLGNIHPGLQAHVLDQMTAKDAFVAADTIDLWINTERDAFISLLPRIQLLVINDSEAHLLTNESNIVLAGAAIRGLGCPNVIIKKGEHGAYFFHQDGIFALPAYPVTNLHDPTGAGDSFAGALLGTLSALGRSDTAAIKQALFYATAVASLTVEAFSVDRLRSAGIATILDRVRELKAMVTAD